MSLRALPLALAATLLAMSGQVFAAGSPSPVASGTAATGTATGVAIDNGAPPSAELRPSLAEALAALPANERFAYSRTTGGRTDRVEIHFSRKRVGGVDSYELLSRSPDEEDSFLLKSTDLSLIRSDMTTKTATTLIHRTTEVLEDRTPLAPDELMIAANPPFLQRLRLLAFDKKPVYRILFQGSPSVPGFSLLLTVSGREKIEAANRSWDCWKVELGAKGVFGGILGKSHYWYQVEWPHILVRSEGPSSFPGSPLVRLDLVSYERTP
ncbi:MAG TPA: hypothetical protein VMV44_03950 [Rectinemataceae bacterium]|nr:hypothetical protein [Rectinemataceae bacterium]